MIRAQSKVRLSMLKRVLGWACWGFGTVAVLYLAFGVYLAAVGNTITFDPVARLAERLPKVSSEADRAWPLYREALVSLHIGTQPGESSEHTRTQRVLDSAAWPGRDEAAWAEASAWCDENAGGFALLREASQRPVLGFPLVEGLADEDSALFPQETVAESRRLAQSPNEPFRLFKSLLPHFGLMRHAAAALAQDAVVAASRGEGSRAVADLEAAFRLSLQLQPPRFLISDLVAVAVRARACNTAVMLLEAMPQAFSDADLAALSAMAHSVPPELARMDLGAERLGFEDVIQWMYTDDGSGSGWFNPGASIEASFGTGAAEWPIGVAGENWLARVVINPAPALWSASRGEVMDRYESWIASHEGRADWSLSQLAASPVTPQSQAIEAMSDIEQSRYFLLWLLMPALDRAHFGFAADRARREALETAVACVQFQRANGKWPGSPDELAPRYLSAPPTDPWTGEPLRLASAGEDFRVWSLGRDGENQGGVVSNEPPGVSTDPLFVRNTWIDPVKADWVLFAPGADIERWFGANARR